MLSRTRANKLTMMMSFNKPPIFLVIVVNPKREASGNDEIGELQGDIKSLAAGKENTYLSIP